jgi:hypothetical protein
LPRDEDALRNLTAALRHRASDDEKEP